MAVISTTGKPGGNGVFGPRPTAPQAAPLSADPAEQNRVRQRAGESVPMKDSANIEKLSEAGAVNDGGDVVLKGAAAAAAEPAAIATARLGVDDDRGLTFEQIHRKYEAKIYNLILRLVGDPDEAQDLTSETFTNAWRYWSRFRGEARVSTWLHQIAVNNCKNHFKQKDRRREREPVSLDDGIDTDSGELSREIPDWREVPEKKLLDQELARQIQRAVDALAPEYRVVLVLALMEGLSYEEIAGVTGLSVPAVKTRLHRARNMMQRRLEPYYRGWTGRQSGGQ